MGNNKSKENQETKVPDVPLKPVEVQQPVPALATPKQSIIEENPTLGKRQQLVDEEPPISRKEFASVLSQMRHLEDQVRKMSRKLEVLEEKDRIHTDKHRETSLALAKLATKEELGTLQKQAAEKSAAVSVLQSQPSPRELRPLDANSTSSTQPLELPSFRYPLGGQSVPNKTGAPQVTPATDPHDLINQIKSQLRKTKPVPEALEETRSLYKKMKLGLQLPSFQPTTLDSLQPTSQLTASQSNQLSSDRPATEANPPARQNS